jgi:hypothetical protein
MIRPIRISNGEGAWAFSRLSHRRPDQSQSEAMGQGVMKKDNDEVLAGKIAHTPGSSCKPAGVPFSC